MAERKRAPKQRRRERKNVPQGHVHIQATFNNTIVTITDLAGLTLRTMVGPHRRRAGWRQQIESEI